MRRPILISSGHFFFFAAFFFGAAFFVVFLGPHFPHAILSFLLM